MQSIIEQSRRGIVPKLTDEQKQSGIPSSRCSGVARQKRSSSMSDDEAMRMIDESIERLRLTLPDRIDVIEALALPDAKARAVQNVRIETLVQFSAEVKGGAGAARDRGVA